MGPFNSLLAAVCLLLLFSPFAHASPAQDPIPITWDIWGVPHIEARTEEQLAYAVGWAQMRANANTVLSLMARARGRLAETPGTLGVEKALAQDIWVRQMGVAQTASLWLTQQRDTERAVLESFARGINDFAANHPEQIDAPLRSVLPIRAVDVLARLAHVLLYEFATSPGMIAADTQAWASGAVPAVAEVQNRGSNAIAIAPGKSAGKALLLSNPHLPWSELVRWFEYESITPDNRFYGVSFLGLPMHVIGFSQALGWTHTVNPMHSYYLYELALQGDGYLLDGKRTAFSTRVETVRVRLPSGQFEEKRIEVRDSLFGPVIARDKQRALALWVTGKDAAHTVSQYREMARAQNLDEFNQSLAQQQIAVFSIIYADRNGQIAYYFGGRNPSAQYPIPRASLLLDGRKSNQLWTAVLPLDKLPQITTPQSGWLQNANDPPWTATLPNTLVPSHYPKGLVNSQFVNLRAQRIIEYLKPARSTDFNALVNLKLDTGSELATRTLDDLIAAGRRSTDSESQVGAQILARWDRAMNAGSRGAPLFQQWVKMMPGDDSIFTVPFNPQDPLAGPRGLAEPAKAAATLADAVRQLRKTGASPDIAWGELYKLPGARLRPGNGGPDPLGLIRATYFDDSPSPLEHIANGGDGFTAIVQFDTPPHARGLLAYGNFTEPSPQGVRNQMQLYADKHLRTLLQLPLSRDDITLSERLPYSPARLVRGADLTNPPVPTTTER
ncbi:penicillin acylase family protein [Pseudomonas sessilinigenes]|uniref:Penicillin acylase family protein n=1 Tax=Pseudomonas sessilinigenes TaxID=658629 RepID=A0ABX8MWH2_9PSED|nr:penicillin acylase family protein [Pseudomonas sessilinigenes]AZC24461.1 hypothetical protein C4K39_2787 [Pseudomonas sessilinigenes]QXH43397.1 penicillin acylase family protein [Pseudomonas sessilinigenes]